MDRNFARALALVLKSEGGWSDNPADPGGATMKGVTLANFRRFRQSDATRADLRQIGNDQVATVYRRFYWDAVAGAELPDGVDYAVFDFAVNSGPGRAAKTLQAVVGTAQDGQDRPGHAAGGPRQAAGDDHRQSLRRPPGLPAAAADLGRLRQGLDRPGEFGPRPGAADVGGTRRAASHARSGAFAAALAVTRASIAGRAGCLERACRTEIRCGG